MNKKTIMWILAVVITIAAAYYQRKTGPTHPKKATVEIAGEKFSFNLIRTGITGKDAKIKLKIPNESVKGTVTYRRYPTKDEWRVTQFKRENDKLIASLPTQPQAGKYEYFVELNDGENSVIIAKENTIKIRFRGDVPAWVLIPHILIIFAAMLLSTVAGLFAYFKLPKYQLYGSIAFFTLIVGGMIFGPLVQKFAFSAFWTGVPFGWDLTDNKTLIAVIFWTIAYFTNRKNEKPIWIIVAAIVLLVIFSIPHSMLGSELDYSSGNIIEA
jgi:hypothetical protein